MAQLLVRHMHFDFDEPVDIAFINNSADFSYVGLAMSLLLPHLEPYLIKTLKSVIPLIQDPQLQVTAQGFCEQEAQHYQQHKKFNRMIRERGYTELDRYEAELARDYQRFLANQSTQFNVGYMEGFEAFTLQMAIFTVELDMLDTQSSELANLFMWHLCEEIEHRTVAHDVYVHLYGNDFYKKRMALFAQQHFLRWVFRVAMYLMRVDKNAIAERFGKGLTRAKQKIDFHLTGLRLFKRVVTTYRTDYDPRQVEIPESVSRIIAGYDQHALKTKAY